jgi:hypothetical protein
VTSLTNQAFAMVTRKLKKKQKVIKIEPHERRDGLACYVMFRASYDVIGARYLLRFWFWFCGCLLVDIDISGKPAISIDRPELNDSRFVRNVSINLRNYTMSKPVRLLLDMARIDILRTYSQSVPNMTACLRTPIYGGILKSLQ